MGFDLVLDTTDALLFVIVHTGARHLLVFAVLLGNYLLHKMSGAHYSVRHNS